jgi:hypothetical protein
MPVPRKLDVAVQRVLIRQLKELASTERNQLFGRSEAAVISHDAAHQAGPEKHVGPLDQHDLSALLDG